VVTELLTRIGIGSATVDTRLANATVVPGDTLRGEVVIQGGSAAQEINTLYLRIMTRYKSDDHTHDLALASHTLAEPMTIQPGSSWQQTFEVQLPYTTPLTLKRTPVYVMTGLDITMALDPKDTDMLRVMPHPLQARFLQSLEELGFYLWQDELERHASWSHSGGGIVQELEFHPNGAYRNRLRELEVIFHLDESSLQVFLEIDRRARGLGLLFESLNEHHSSLRFTSADLDRTDWTAQIQSAIDARL
jgi:sporulation-control protein